GLVDVRVDYSHRFLAKLALGLGFTLLGMPFLNSPYAQQLRRALREGDFRKRGEIAVRKTGFDSRANDVLSRVLYLRGAWVLAFLPSTNDLSLAICTPTGRTATVVVSDDPAIWRDAATVEFQYGLVFVIQPQQQFFEGPIPLPQFREHQVGGVSITRLA